VAFGPIGWIIPLPSSFYNLTVEGGQSGIIQKLYLLPFRGPSACRRYSSRLLFRLPGSVSGEGARRRGGGYADWSGFKPLSAAVVCLVANTPPTPFGPVGVPTSMMIQSRTLTVG